MLREFSNAHAWNASACPEKNNPANVIGTRLTRGRLRTATEKTRFLPPRAPPWQPSPPHLCCSCSIITYHGRCRFSLCQGTYVRAAWYVRTYTPGTGYRMYAKIFPAYLSARPGRRSAGFVMLYLPNPPRVSTPTLIFSYPVKVSLHRRCSRFFSENNISLPGMKLFQNFFPFGLKTMGTFLFVETAYGLRNIPPMFQSACFGLQMEEEMLLFAVHVRRRIPNKNRNFFFFKFLYWHRISGIWLVNLLCTLCEKNTYSLCR